MVVTEEICNLCGKNARFTIDADAVSYREAVCEYCGASIRNSDTAKIIVFTLLNKDMPLSQAVEELSNFTILGTRSAGSIHSILRELPGYVYGEYFDEVKSGDYQDGILCVDLKDSHFDSEYFDLIISEDVLEHVDNINMAFREINRILKISGCHVFSVPFHPQRRTLDRSCSSNKVYHGDPLRSEGALVYTDFGQDTQDILKQFGMSTECFTLHKFFPDDEISDVDAEFSQYTRLNKQPLRYFKYNSVVFCSKKMVRIHSNDNGKGDKQVFTGERFIPGVQGEIAGEHFHRYYAVQELIKNKIVVDAACGEGYGTFLLSQHAKLAIGIDIDSDSIQRARNKYISDRGQYIHSSIEKLPLNDQSIDVVVSFETIEHVSRTAQYEFLKEVKRVLKKEGYLIISTPDRTHYSDKYNYRNEYHVQEFYFDEFKQFLASYFQTVYLYDQGFESVSLISPHQLGDYDTYRFIRQAESWKMNNKRYILAICSDAEVQDKETVLSLMYQDGISHERDFLKMLEQHHNLIEQHNLITQQAQKIKHLQTIIFEQGYANMMKQLQGKKIVFFGTGSGSKKIQDRLPLQAAYFVDNNQQKWGQMIDDKKIYAPEQLLREDKHQMAVIVASQYFDEIAKQLMALGFEENINFWNGYDLFIDPVKFFS